MKNIQKNKISFNDIDWELCNAELSRLQEKLTVAHLNKDLNKVINLQKLIAQSFAARALAVKKVTTNRGKHTPGVDGEIWNTAKEKTEAIFRLKTKDYKALPLKRIYIPKAKGKMRPLSIPCLIDRAMQALYSFTLDPIAESTSDVRSYGFRKYKGCKDALAYCHNILNGKNRAKYILEGDIKGCFDNINHEWIFKNIPMDKNILKEFINAGFIENNRFHKTTEGVPQGGVISPIITNMVLNGLENKIRDLFKLHSNYLHGNPKVNYVRYADDFIVTASSVEILKEKIMPVIESFLLERGLTLNKEKTKITHISEGFDFLGVTFKLFRDEGKKSGQITLSYPNKKSIQSLKKKVKLIFKTHNKTNPVALINHLNPLIRGWANYHNSISSKGTFTKLDNFIFNSIWIWARKRSPKLSRHETKKQYFHKVKARDWIFFSKTKEKKTIELFLMAKTPIIRHKICQNKNPYLKTNQTYYLNRLNKDIKILYGSLYNKLCSIQGGLCVICKTPINSGEELDIHHIEPKGKGGKNKLENLLLIHTNCHKTVTFTKNQDLRAKYEKLGITKNNL